MVCWGTAASSACIPRTAGSVVKAAGAGVTVSTFRFLLFDDIGLWKVEVGGGSWCEVEGAVGKN